LFNKWALGDKRVILQVLVVIQHNTVVYKFLTWLGYLFMDR